MQKTINVKKIIKRGIFSKLKYAILLSYSDCFSLISTMYLTNIYYKNKSEDLN